MPIATSVVPCRHARPNESLTITAGAIPKRPSSAVTDPCGRCVRVTRKQNHDVLARRIRPVDAGTRADEPVLGLGDDEVAATAAHRARLAQDHLDVVGGLLDATFFLRDDLLRHDDHVARVEPTRALDRIPDELRKVHARLHVGDAFQRHEPYLAHRPSSRSAVLPARKPDSIAPSMKPDQPLAKSEPAKTTESSGLCISA